MVLQPSSRSFSSLINPLIVYPRPHIKQEEAEIRYYDRTYTPPSLLILYLPYQPCDDSATPKNPEE